VVSADPSAGECGVESRAEKMEAQACVPCVRSGAARASGTVDARASSAPAEEETMTTRVMAIRELAKGGTDEEPSTQDGRWSASGAVRIAAWVAAVGAGGLLLRRVIRRRRRIDLGMVSEDWVARHRAVPSDPFFG
jgi:hypothetical protein